MVTMAHVQYNGLFNLILGLHSVQYVAFACIIMIVLHGWTDSANGSKLAVVGLVIWHLQFD